MKLFMGIEYNTEISVEIITKTGSFLVDKADIAILNKTDALWNINKGYVRSVSGGTSVRLHRLLMKVQEGLVVDHINGNGLDNRRCNLRICTNAENLYNTGASKNNTSGIKGVTWHKASGRWLAQIMVNHEHKYLGTFILKESAAKAVQDARTKYHKGFTNHGLIWAKPNYKIIGAYNV